MPPSGDNRIQKITVTDTSIPVAEEYMLIELKINREIKDLYIQLGD